MITTGIAGADIASSLAGHQQTVTWDWKDLAEQLYTYDRLLRDRFDLDLPPFVIRFGRLRRSTYGYFREGWNEFAVAGEIAINLRYVECRPFGETIGTLHHEQLHLWQHVHGRPGKGNYHNREFQQKAAESGLIVDSRGYTKYAQDGRFIAFLQDHGIEPPSQSTSVADRRSGANVLSGGNSKLKRWSCLCTNVWAAVPNIAVNCLKCGQLFSQRTSASPKRDR